MKNKINYTLYPIHYSLTPKGFSQLILVGLIAVGIITGTVLVQNGVNFIPMAAEQEPLNPSAGRTKDCSNAEDKEACQRENDAICADDTVTYCDNREGSPRAIRKSGGYYDPSHGNADPASGCVFDYREVSGKNSECAKPESESGHVVYTTTDEANQLDTERERTREERERQSGSSSQSESERPDAVCTEPNVEQAMKDEKVTGNLVRYYAILAGMPEYCVPMDLGVEPRLTAKTADSNQTGRLMLCSGENSDLTWRVLVSNNLLRADKQPPTKESVESDYAEYVNKAKERAQPIAPQTPAQNPPANSQTPNTGTGNRPPIIGP